MARKILHFVAIALLALITVVIARNDLVVGSIRADSILLYQQTYNRSGTPGVILSQNVVYTNQLRNISRVRALDLSVNGTGGFATIIAGGVGQRNVTIRLASSAAGRGYNFFVDVYGN